MRMSSGPSKAETETPRRVIDLGRAHAQVHQNAGNAAAGQVRQMRKAFMPYGKTRIRNGIALCMASGSRSKAIRRP
jgi:HPt (histidine-containing phosphotransfer) domain-containing protein